MIGAMAIGVHEDWEKCISKWVTPLLGEVEEYDAGIIVDSNVDSVFNGLNKMLNESNLEQLSNNASRLIQDRFLVGNLIKKYGHSKIMYFGVIILLFCIFINFFNLLSFVFQL